MKMMQTPRVLLNVVDIVIPHTYNETLNSPQADKWKQAIQDEINYLEKNET